MVALSTHEAEFIAATQGYLEALSVRHLLEELGINVPLIHLFLDNQSVIADIKRGAWSSRTRHLDVRYLFLHEEYKTGFMGVHFLPTQHMIADMNTKALAKPKFQEFRDIVLNGNINIDNYLSGGVVNNNHSESEELHD